ncbi:helix-turn-helix domain-containing protein [Candidatus Binatus sp.]|uniref:helix-turn-helix domain-containing protein n=1 Tax=Candidatus Binatus sp. TaxID=2811406 RepID=UPI0039C8934F
MSRRVGVILTQRSHMDRFDKANNRILTVRDVSNYLRVHPSTIYKMLKRNQLPAFRVGSDWRFTVEAIDQWLASAEPGAAPRAAREAELSSK